MSTEEPWRRATGNKLDKPDNNSGWRRSTNNNNNNNGGRPKLNLSKRGEAKQVEDKGDDGKVEDVTEKVENVALSEEKKESQRNQGKRERRFREPEVVNSRAAMLGEAAAPRKEELVPNRSNRDRRTRDGPPQVSSRFASAAADYEKEREDTRIGERGPPPQVANSRFASAAADYEKEREVRDMERGRGLDDRGPPPQVVNSRFASAAADYEKERGEREEMRAGENRGPPPQVTNSRFASAAADYEKEREVRDMERHRGNDDRGPPQVANSRFASAAADYDRERSDRDRDRGDRFDRRRDDDGYGGGRFGRDVGPPPMQNSRFAAALEDDPDYVPAEVRQQRDRERAEQGERGGPGGDRFGREDDRRGDGRGFGENRGSGRYGDRGGRYNNRGEQGEVELPRGPSWKQDPSLSANEFPPINKGNVSNILAPKKREEETVLPPVAVPLTLPGEDEEAAKARLEKVRAEKEAKAAKEKAEKEAKEAEEARLAEEAKARAAKAQEAEATLLNEFISGNKLGDDLKQWCADNAAVLPSVEKLVFHLLSEKEAKNPNPECPWAEPSQYGSALLSLVQDKGYEQMQVLWAIQKYCDSIGFPKLNDEYVVQSMFRAMYKYDITEPGAFDEWKEDESEANSQGKMKAVIQTMDWFAWLEEDDEESEEEYEEEEE